MQDDPLKSIERINQEFGIGVVTPKQADTLNLPDLQTGALGVYAPQSEESKLFMEEWDANCLTI